MIPGPESEIEPPETTERGQDEPKSPAPPREAPSLFQPAGVACEHVQRMVQTCVARPFAHLFSNKFGKRDIPEVKDVEDGTQALLPQRLAMMVGSLRRSNANR